MAQRVTTSAAQNCLHRSFPTLRFEHCYSSASNLCANWVCLMHTLKYILLESSSVQNHYHSCVRMTYL